MLSKHRIPATLAPGAQGAPADGGRSGADDSSLLWRTWIRTKWLRSERSTIWFCRPCHLRNQDSSHTDAVSIQVGCIVHFFLLSRFSRIRTPQVSYLRGRQASATPNSICIFCLWWAFSQTKFCRFCTAGPTKTVVIHLLEIIPYGFTHYHVFANVLIHYSNYTLRVLLTEKCRAWLVPAAFIHPCHGQRVEILQQQIKPWRPWRLKRWRWLL